MSEVYPLPRVVRWSGDSDAQMFRNVCNDLDAHDNALAAERAERKADVQTLGEKLDRNTQALFALAGSVVVAALGIIAVLLTTRLGH